MAKIVLTTENLPALPNGTHPYAVREIIDALSNLAEEGKLGVADLRAIADGIGHMADNRGALNYQDRPYGATENPYEHFGL